MSQDYDEYQYTNISTGTTTQVATGKGKLHSIVVNTTANGTIIIADSTSTTTPAIGTLKASVAEGTFFYDVYFANGLRIVTAGASDITVCWKKG